MKVQRAIAHNMRKRRVALGLSQEKLAVDAQIDRTYVSRLERGLENPTVGLVERVAQALGVDIVDLVTRPRSGERFPSALPGGRRPRSR